VGAGGRKMEAAILLLQPHAGPEVRQPQGGTRPPNGEGVRSVEREEPDSWDSMNMDVCAHIELMGSAHERERREEDGPDAPHGERRHAHPGLPLEGIQAQPGGDQRPQALRSDGPVQEEQLL
jgi:hypothetical protein